MIQNLILKYDIMFCRTNRITVYDEIIISNGSIKT
jgi:hypothetical protein